MKSLLLRLLTVLLGLGLLQGLAACGHDIPEPKPKLEQVHIKRKIPTLDPHSPTVEPPKLDVIPLCTQSGLGRLTQ